mgnify:CR=1 FL=1
MKRIWYEGTSRAGYILIGLGSLLVAETTAWGFATDPKGVSGQVWGWAGGLMILRGCFTLIYRHYHSRQTGNAE